jgi:SAM-dependent methyltransferase
MNSLETSLVREPLDETWQHSLNLANSHCQDCGWYHGLWPYLRVIGAGKTLSGQSRWFLEQLRRHRSKEGVKVLISGCADYSAFAHAIEGLGLQGASGRASAQVFAVDRCRTPLKLNELLSSKTGVPIINDASDILEFQTSQKFDLIFTSSFVGYFHPTQRPLLFKKYLSLLKPGGELVFAGRVQAGTEDDFVRLSADGISKAVEGALELNRRFTAAEKMGDQEFEDRVEEYLRHKGSYRLNSAAGLEALIRDAGFPSLVIETRAPQLPQHQVRLTAPSFAEDTPYLCVVARAPTAVG